MGREIGSVFHTILKDQDQYQKTKLEIKESLDHFTHTNNEQCQQYRENIIEIKESMKHFTHTNNEQYQQYQENIVQHINHHNEQNQKILKKLDEYDILNELQKNMNNILHCNKEDTKYREYLEDIITNPNN